MPLPFVLLKEIQFSKPQPFLRPHTVFSLMESLRQAPQPREKFPSDSHKLDSESIMKAGLFMAHLQKEQSATVPKPIRETPQEISQRILFLSEENFSKIRTLFSAEPQPKTRQEQIERLFGILKDGGSLGMHYAPNKGESKTPNQVLSAMKGDCDELALVFIASAKKLNIDTSDMGVAVLGFVVLGKEKEVLHATAFTMTGENRLLDLTRNSPEKLESIDAPGFTKAYANQRLATGDLILGVRSMEVMSTLEEMVSIHFRETAAYYETVAKPTGSAALLSLLEKTISLMETALRLNPGSLAYQTELIRLRIEVAEKYADKGNYDTVEQHASRVLQYPIASSLNELAQERKRDIARAHGLMGEAYSNRNKYKAALDEFKTSAQLNPEDYRAYEGQAVAYNELGSNTESGEKAGARDHFLAAKVAIETALAKFVPSQKDRERLLQEKEVIEKNLEKSSQ